MPGTSKVPLPLPSTGLKGQGVVSVHAGHPLRPGDSCPLQASPEHSTHLLTLGYASVLGNRRQEIAKPGPYGKVTHFKETPSFFREEGANTSLRLNGSKGFRDSNPELAILDSVGGMLVVLRVRDNW